MNGTMWQLYRQYVVAADSVADFLDRYYKPDRFHGRGEEYASSLVSYEKQFQNAGFVYISRRDSITGRSVSYYGPEVSLPEDQMLQLMKLLREAVVLWPPEIMTQYVGLSQKINAVLARYLCDNGVCINFTFSGICKECEEMQGVHQSS